MVWAVLATVFLACSALVNLILFVLVISSSAGAPAVHRPTIFHEQMVGGSRYAREKVAVIYLNGLISYNVQGVTGPEGMVGDLKEQLRVACEDRSVKAIVLVVDSPGGEVTASDDLYRAVVDAKFRKPVVVNMTSLAASGGYYVAVGGNYLIAAESTITGSIGVLMQALNYRKLLEKVGLDIITIKSGKFKDLLNGAREPNPAEMALVEALIMQSYEQFVGIVAKERKLDVQKLKAGVADGRVLSGKQAKEENLVDALGYFDDAVKKANELAGISESRVVKYIAPFSLRNLFQILGKSDASKIQVNVGPELMRLENGKLYYVAEQFLAARGDATSALLPGGAE